MMTPDQALWVRENVWPAWMKAMDDDYNGRGCFLFHMCHCQLGACVACSQDEHNHCLTRQHKGAPLGWDMHIYAWTKGRQPINGRSVADVTIAGRNCRWVCPCRCWKPRRPGPVRAGAVMQLDLFGALV